MSRYGFFLCFNAVDWSTGRASGHCYKSANSGDCPRFLGTHYYLKNRLSHGLQIWQIHSHGPTEQKPIKNFPEREHGHIQGLPNFWDTLLYQDWVKPRTYWQVHSQRTSERKPIKNFRQRGEGLPKFFGYPLLSQEWEKLQISDLASTFIESIRSKAH